MRHFHSYGPVDCKKHFCIQREDLIGKSVDQLIGDPEEGGYYFTIWAPRQTGKTWLMRRVKEEIPRRFPGRFTVLNCSLGNLRGMKYEIEKESDPFILPDFFRAILETELPGRPDIADWRAFTDIFSRDRGLWERPLILMIDEVDTTPPALLDLMVGRFREMYQSRGNNWLHGLALIGVRAVLGVDSERGSPFNIQKSMRVPNLTFEEVRELYRQYQEESGQRIDHAVVEKVFSTTNGQPGLVSWFGELLTETYNPGLEKQIDMDALEEVWLEARTGEVNNNLFNLIAKAREPKHRGFLTELFTTAEIPFSFHDPLHGYLYMHGIIKPVRLETPNGQPAKVCAFASPFIQRCLYDALGPELIADRRSFLALDPLDDLADVFDGPSLDLPALLERYKAYLGRLKARGVNPWKDQPRRKTDSHLTEAVGHFHLYAWLQAAIGRRCVVSPEFPTGNGKVDLHLKCGDKQGIIEVKSFVDAHQAKSDRARAAQYAKSLEFDAVTLATFIAVEDDAVLEKLSGEEVIDGVTVTVKAVGWT